MTTKADVTTVTAALIACLVAASVASAQAPRMLRSAAGPSGTVVGNRFVLDETRNRFVYPQDQTVTVYFEFEATPGDHVLSATWRQPDGRVVSVSPDVRIQAPDKELNGYWLFSIAPTLASGTWTVEVRIDGQPAGSHSFELAGVDPSGGKVTLDQVFKTYGPSIVRVHKLDQTGRRVDTSLGFVYQAGAVATSFQSIDSAAGLELEFGDGRRVTTRDVFALSRLGDWAVIKADTAAIAPVPRAATPVVAVGGRLAAFSDDAGTRVVVPLAVGAVSSVPGYGSRIRATPYLPPEAAGGPLIDESGHVVGLVGGSLTPGVRISPYVLRLTPWMGRVPQQGGAGTGIGELPTALPAATRTLADLQATAILTTALVPMVELTMGGTTTALSKSSTAGYPREITEFVVGDGTPIDVYTYWAKKDKLSKGEVSGKLYDASNRLISAVAPKKVTLRESDQRFSFGVSPKALTPGYYRIDFCWDDKPVWRTYIRIIE